VIVTATDFAPAAPVSASEAIATAISMIFRMSASSYHWRQMDNLGDAVARE
jgi:hypothetical protein